MPRAVLLFRRVGLNVIPYPADFKVDDKKQYDTFSFLPSSYAFYINSQAVKEYLGIVAIKMKLQ